MFYPVTGSTRSVTLKFLLLTIILIVNSSICYMSMVNASHEFGVVSISKESFPSTSATDESNVETTMPFSYFDVLIGRTGPRCSSVHSKGTDSASSFYSSSPFSSSYKGKARVYLTLGDGQCKVENETINISAKFAMDIIDSFKNDYTLERLGLPWILANLSNSDTENDLLYICDRNDNYFQVLPSINTSAKDPPSTQEELKKVMVECLEISQRYEVALENLIIDEFINEVTYMDNISESHRKMRDLLAELLASAKSCDLDANPELLQNLIRKTYCAVDTSSQRNHRGFRTLRQCLMGLQYIIEMFPYGN